MHARIAPKALRQYPWMMRLLFYLQKKRFGQILTPTLLWAYSPWQCFAYSLFFLAIDRKSSPLDAELKSLVMVRVAQLNWCRYCVDINSSFLLERTDTEAKVWSLENWKQSELYTPKERCALEYAESMTLAQARVSDELYLRLKGFFNSDQIIELTGVIAYQNLSAKFNAALDLAPQGFCRLPNTTKAPSP